MTRSCSSSNVLFTNGWPSTISETSVDVPPTSAAEQVAVADRVAKASAGDRPRRRPGEDDPERLLECLRPRQQRRGAVGEVEVAGEPEPAQLSVELAARSR